MYTKKFLIIACFSLLYIGSHAQSHQQTEEADARSLALYNSAQWKALVIYGNEKLTANIDFPLLRMRTGYAAFMLGNYSMSLTQYKKVAEADPDNKLALYYVYLNNLYLNNTTAARYYAEMMPAETRVSEKIEKYKLSGLETEISSKTPSDTIRKNALYARLGLNLQLGYRFELQQSVALYNQTINEPGINPPGFSYVNNPQRINIQQKEYYAKLIYAVDGNVSLIGGFHYLYTPFNNLVYNNTLVFGGIKYATPYVHFDAKAYLGNISDSSSNQFEAAVTAYPLGNTRLYSISKAAYNKSFVFSQVAGFGISKSVWLEGNITLGNFYNLFENDGLYVYNDIDQKNFKAGGSIYASLSKNLVFSANYTFEQKTRFKTTRTFNQNSITGGLSWRF